VWGREEGRQIVEDKKNSWRIEEPPIYRIADLAAQESAVPIKAAQFK
jgi:hypothetical protein